MTLRGSARSMASIFRAKRRSARRTPLAASPRLCPTRCLRNNSSLPVAAKSFVEGVARPAHRANGIRLGLGRQGLAQAADVHVDGALVDLGREAPDAVELTAAKRRLRWHK